MERNLELSALSYGKATKQTFSVSCSAEWIKTEVHKEAFVYPRYD